MHLRAEALTSLTSDPGGVLVTSRPSAFRKRRKWAWGWSYVVCIIHTAFYLAATRVSFHIVYVYAKWFVPLFIEWGEGGETVVSGLFLS